jgi:hypothetical protein
LLWSGLVAGPVRWYSAVPSLLRFAGIALVALVAGGPGARCWFGGLVWFDPGARCSGRWWSGSSIRERATSLVRFGPGAGGLVVRFSPIALVTYSARCSGLVVRYRATGRSLLRALVVGGLVAPGAGPVRSDSGRVRALVLAYRWNERYRALVWSGRCGPVRSGSPGARCAGSPGASGRARCSGRWSVLSLSIDCLVTVACTVVMLVYP